MYTFKNVQYSYQANSKMFNFDFKLNNTGITVLAGDNGAGKSTLIRLMAGLSAPTHGEIYFKKQILNYQILPNKFYQHVGIVLQNPDYMLFNPTVLDELAYGPRQIYDEKTVLELVDQWAKRFSLTTLLQQAPYQLSGGQKKLVSIISILINQPDILILDEPFEGLSLDNIALVKDYLLQIKAKHKIVLAHHDLNSIKDLVDDLLLIKDRSNQPVITNLEQIHKLSNLY